jgi:hypothetical protein
MSDASSRAQPRARSRLSWCPPRMSGGVAPAAPVDAVAASPQRRAADVNVGVGYFPQQVGTALAFGATCYVARPEAVKSESRCTAVGRS